MKKKLVYWCVCWALVFLAVPLSAGATELPVGVSYRGHIQDRGDYPLDGSWVDSPELIGTVGQSKRIEGFLIKLDDDLPTALSIRYNVHVQNKGWLYDENDPMDWPKDGAYAGTRGESLRIEAVKIVLTDSAGKPVPGYSVLYRGHVQNVGDQPQATDSWLADGDQLGTVGSSLRLEALLVKVVKNSADLSAYTALVAKVARLTEGDFTAQSWAALQTAMTNHAVNADLPQAEVDVAVAAIQAAYDGLIKKTEATVYDQAGTFGPASGSQTIDGDVRIAADGVILENLQITGDLLISEAVGDGTVTLNHVTVDGDTVVRGGGANSIHINGGSYSRIVMEKTASGAVRIVAKDVSGLDVVISEDATGETIILEGVFDSVEVNAPNMIVTTQGNATTIGRMTVGAAGVGSTVTLNTGTTVADLILDGKAAIKGSGNVVKAEVRADGVVFDKKPGAFTVAPGVVIAPVFPPPSDGGGGYNPPAPVAVTGVSLDQTSLSVGVTRTAHLNATVLPANAANKSVSWTSSDAAVATVDGNGTVHGVSEGTATITVKTTDGEKTKTCPVTVTTSFEVIETTIGSGTITGMNGSSKDITIPETIDGLTITGIGAEAFKGKTNVTAVTIPQTVTGIGDNAFNGCMNMTTLTFSGSPTLETIGTRAFIGCSSLEAVTVPATVTSIGADAFMQSGLSSLIFAPSTHSQTIGARAFWANNNLTTVTIPNAVTSIGSQAFWECETLKTVVFAGGSENQTLGNSVFSKCYELETVTFESDSKIANTGPNFVNSCSKLSRVDFPAALTTLGYNAFSGCPASLELVFDGNAPTQDSAAIPTGTTIAYWEGKTGFTDSLWPGCTLRLRNARLTQTDVTVNSASFSFAAQNGASEVKLEQKVHTDSTWSPATTTEPLSSVSTTATATGLTPGTSYDFRLQVTGGDTPGPSTVVSLTTEVAVTGISLNKTTLDLSQNSSEIVTAIVEPGDAANNNLNWTTSDETIATVDGTGLVTAKSVGTATITATATDGSGQTASCAVTVLPYSFTITDGTVTITEYLNNEASVSIPETIGGKPVVAIGDQAFIYKTNLTEVTIPASVTSIGQGAFHICQNLTTVHFAPDSQLSSIALNGFSECPLTSLTLPSQLQTISNYSFYHNHLSGSLTIPATVTYIGDNAFEGKMDGTTHLSNLQTLTIQSTGVLSIRPSAFKFQPLTTITLPADVSIGGDSATVGTNGTGFLSAYIAGGAGTYQFVSGAWSRE